MPASTHVESDSTIASESSSHSQKRMVRYRPSEALGTRFPAMHLVRSSWLCRVIARATAGCMVLFLLAAIFVPWQQTSRGEGVVTARNPNERRQVFLSTAKGIIAEQKLGLQEGSHVEKGETIMVLDTLAKDQIEMIQSQQKQLSDKKSFTQSQLEFAITQVQNTEESGRQLIRAAQAEIEAAHAKWESAEAEVEAQLARLRQAEFDVKAYEPLAGKTVSQQKYQQAINDEIVEANKLIRAERAKDEAANFLEAKRRDLDSKRQEIDKKVSEARQKVDEYRSKLTDIEKESQDISVKLGELERLRIVSPT
nr:HlyD family secretion protein [Pirellula sp.]